MTTTFSKRRWRIQIPLPLTFFPDCLGKSRCFVVVVVSRQIVRCRTQGTAAVIPFPFSPYCQILSLFFVELFIFPISYCWIAPLSWCHSEIGNRPHAIVPWLPHHRGYLTKPRHFLCSLFSQSFFPTPTFPNAANSELRTDRPFLSKRPGEHSRTLPSLLVENIPPLYFSLCSNAFFYASLPPLHAPSRRREDFVVFALSFSCAFPSAFIYSLIVTESSSSNRSRMFAGDEKVVRMFFLSPLRAPFLFRLAISFSGSFVRGAP